MIGLKQIGHFRTTGDDGRAHTVFVYRDAPAPANGNATASDPFFVTNDGWEVARVRDGIFRVFGTGMTLRSAGGK